MFIKEYERCLNGYICKFIFHLRQLCAIAGIPFLAPRAHAEPQRRAASALCGCLGTGGRVLSRRRAAQRADKGRSRRDGLQEQIHKEDGLLVSEAGLVLDERFNQRWGGYFSPFQPQTWF